MQFGKFFFIVALAACWAGCDFAPKYSRPAAVTPATFKEDSGTNNTDTNIWQAAHPDDAVIRSNWWETFNDSQLNALEQQVAISNQNVVAAFENFLSAHATVHETQAEYFPTVNLDPSASRSRTYTGGGLTLHNPNVDNFDMPLDASWELDLWGRIRNSVKAAAGQAQASAADLENTKLAAQAELASDYFQLVGQDSQIKLFDDTVNDYSNSLQLTEVLFKTGIDSDQDVAQAETQLETTESQASNLRILRATLEHAIAVLIGQPPSTFSIAPMPANVNPPFIPVAIPSQLLERRPDVAAAERAVFSANAEIGVARSAFFPAVTLSASGAFESSTLGLALFHWGNRVWSLGAGASQAIFNAALPPALTQYRAEYDGTVAQYRQTVLTAFQGVEDNLATLRILKIQIQQQQVAVDSSQKYLNLALYRYKLGIDSYLDVITAQTTLLTNRQTLDNLYTSQMTAAVTLIEDLGGGWDAKELPKD
jgi:NodT family efflux transporter outer membrane factor (OMF) lipoprotein